MSLSLDKTNRPVFVKGLYFKNGLIFQCGRYKTYIPFTLYPCNGRCQNTLDEVSATVRCTSVVDKAVEAEEEKFQDITSAFTGPRKAGVHLLYILLRCSPLLGIYYLGCYRPFRYYYCDSNPPQADRSTQGIRRFMEK